MLFHYWSRATLHRLMHSASQDCPLFRHQPYYGRSLGLPSLLTSWLQFWGPPTHSLRFNNSLDWFIELRKVLYLRWQFYCKGYNQKQSNEEVHRVSSRGCQRQNFCALCRWNQGTSPLWHIDVFTNQEVPLSFSAQSLFGVSLQRRDGLNHWPCAWTQYPAPIHPWRVGWNQWLKAPRL